MAWQSVVLNATFVFGLFTGHVPPPKRAAGVNEPVVGITDVAPLPDGLNDDRNVALTAPCCVPSAYSVFDVCGIVTGVARDVAFCFTMARMAANALSRSCWLSAKYG